MSYTAVELTFFATALPLGYLFWHATTGEWLEPLLLLQEDGAEGKARLAGLLLCSPAPQPTPDFGKVGRQNGCFRQSH